MPIPLVETSEREIAHKIRRRIRGLQEVDDCRQVSLGFTRKKPHIQLHVQLKGNPAYEEIHRICSIIENEVRKLVPNARVAIHSEPHGESYQTDIWKLVMRIAEGEPGSRGAQNIHLKGLEGRLEVDFLLTMSRPTTPKQAQTLEEELEKKLKAADPRISGIVIHHETVSELVSTERSGHGTELKSYIDHILQRFPEITQLHPPLIRRMGDQLHVKMRVAFASDLDTKQSSEITSRLAASIMKGFPEITKAEIIEEQTNLTVGHHHLTE